MDVLDRAGIRYPSSSDFSPMMRPAPPGGESPLGRRLCRPALRHGGRAVPLAENRPGVLRCRKCRQNTGLTVGTVMERSHISAERLVLGRLSGRQSDARHVRRAVSAARLGLSRYETVLSNSPRLRSGMVRPNQDRIGGQPKNHVEVENLGWRANGEGRGVHHKVLVSCAIEVRHRKPGTKLDNRKDGRLPDAFGSPSCSTVAPSRSVGVESTVAPGADRG